MGLGGGFPFDYMITCDKLVSLNFFFDYEDTTESHSNILVWAPNIRNFESVDIGCIKFVVGIPNVVSIKILNSIQSQETVLIEDDDG